MTEHIPTAEKWITVQRRFEKQAGTKTTTINHLTRLTFKGALCSFGEEIQTHSFNIYNINEVKNKLRN